MNLLFNILLAAGLIALCHSACEVCNCAAAPPLFDEDFFNENLKNEYLTETRTFVQPTGVKVVDCKIELECNFPVIDDEQENYKAVVGTLGNSAGYFLQDLNCVNGSQWHSETEGDIQSVGCYVSVPMF